MDSEDSTATTTQPEITGWLRRWSAGDDEALGELLSSVYDELHRVGERLMRRERPGHTLQPTAVVHEAFFDLVRQKRVCWQNRDHFLGVASSLMHRVLMRHAESKRAAKRGGGFPDLPLQEAIGLPSAAPGDHAVLTDALADLASCDQRQSRIVELRIFGGFKVEEVARALDISPITVKRDWRMAKAWLRGQIVAARSLD